MHLYFVHFEIFDEKILISTNGAITRMLSLQLRNKSGYWNVHGIMNTSGLFTLTLQETRSIHDSMDISLIEFIAYILIFL